MEPSRMPKNSAKILLPALATGFVISATPVLAPDASSAQVDPWENLGQLPDWWKDNWEGDRAAGGGNANSYLPELPLTPVFKKKRDEMVAQAKRLGGDTNTNTKLCIPVGALRVMMRITRLYEFIFTPG